jgi:beta-glucosidase
MNDRPFLVGSVLTASELEGVAETADWSRWIARGRAPEAGDGAGFRSTWGDDLAQLAELGLDEITITLEWARLWPTAAGPDDREIEFRRDLLRAVRDLEMQPWACLVDGTLPGWFADDERGFTDDRARRLIWPRHVDWIGETFGDLVAGWVPMREPRQWAAWGHLVGATPPGNQRRRDTKKMIDALDRAELEAERLLRGSAPVASYVTARRVISGRDNVKAAPHAQWLDHHLGGRWIDELSDGRARDAFDRLIVQLRPPIVVDDEGSWHALPNGGQPEPLLDGLDAVMDAVGDRSVIAAGDLSGVPVEGAAAVEHLETMIEGVREREVDGWWQTSPIDGWHWQHGFQRTPGVIDRERNRRTAADVLVDAQGSLDRLPDPGRDTQPSA